MGLILDSSVVIAAERRGYTVEQFIAELASHYEDQDAALSSIGVTELVHGIYRATTPQFRARREFFIQELVAVLAVYPYTSETAIPAARIGGEQQANGVSVRFSDLLIGATALSLGFSVLTFNPRYFKSIPGLKVLPLWGEEASQGK